MESTIKKIHTGLTVFFIFTATLFVAIYFPLTYQTCQQTINRVDYYVENTTCFCNTNVGSNTAFAKKMVEESSWGRSLNGTGLGKMLNNNGNDLRINIYPIAQWIQNYYGYIFTNKITQISFNALEFNDPFEINDPFQTIHICIIKNGTESIFYDSFDSCLNKILEFFPNFDPIFTLDYNNEVYQEICGGISYCEVNFCSSSSIVNIILFCGSIVTSMYTLIRVIKYFVRITLIHYHKKKQEKIEIDSPVYRAV